MRRAPDAGRGRGGAREAAGGGAADARAVAPADGDERARRQGRASRAAGAEAAPPGCGGESGAPGRGRCRGGRSGRAPARLAVVGGTAVPHRPRGAWVALRAGPARLWSAGLGAGSRLESPPPPPRPGLSLSALTVRARRPLWRVRAGPEPRTLPASPGWGRPPPGGPGRVLREPWRCPSGSPWRSGVCGQPARWAWASGVRLGVGYGSFPRPSLGSAGTFILSGQGEGPA